MSKVNDFSLCVVIPTYNHSTSLAPILQDLQKLGLYALVINDGSTKEKTKEIEEICKQYAQNTDWESFTENQGKGAAVIAGLKKAYKKGFSHALQLDADGQHDRSRITFFVEQAQKKPSHLIQGQPIYDETAPKSRKYGRLINHFWVCIETLTTKIVDTMCGFRVYPLEGTINVLKHHKIAHHMDFDTDIYVHMRWHSIPVSLCDVRVTYIEGNLSNFKGLRDNVYISLGHTKRFLWFLLTFPQKYIALKQKKKEPEYWHEKKEIGSHLGMSLIFYCYRLFGRKACLFILRFVSLYYFLVKKDVRDNLNHYLVNLKNSQRPDTKIGFWSSYRIIYNFSVATLDRFLSWGPARNKIVMKMTEKSRSYLKALSEEQRGAIFIGVHMGVLDITRSRGFSLDIPMINVLHYGAVSQRYLKFVESKNLGDNFRFVETSQFDMNTAFTLQEKIQNNEWIFCAADRILGDVNEKTSITVPFLGQPASFPIGPLLMAKLFGCPVYTVLNIRPNKASPENPNRDFEAHVEPLFEHVDFSRKTRFDDLEKYVLKYSQWVETICMEHPYDWFNFHDFWQQNIKDENA